MSKLSFRARALDATKPLPIYHAVDLPDLSEYTTINRTVPQMPTGMEKEEETERHLQDVIIAQQTNSTTSKHLVIPTPENAIDVPYYKEITSCMDRPPKFIRIPGLSLDEEVPDYDLDSEDEEWLNLQTNEKPLSSLHFESMMDKLEKGSGNLVLSEREAMALLKDDDDLVLAVYDYWLAKRLRLGRALMPTVKHERRDGTSSGSNPYLAFRKRTEKMQTRKNRKNDETAYMQMQKLKRDLDKALALSGLVKEREEKKYEMAGIHMDIFKKRYLLEDWSGSIMTSLCPVATRSATTQQISSVNESPWDGSSVLIKMDGGDDYNVHQVGRHEVLVSSGLKRKKRKKYYYPSHSLESPLPPVPATPEKLDPSRDLSLDKYQEEELDGKFTFKRKPHVKYHPVYYRPMDWPWNSDDTTSLHHMAVDGGSDGELEYGTLASSGTGMPKPKKFRFSRLTLSGQFVGLCRKRAGRGGRILIDCIPTSSPYSSDDEETSNDFCGTPMETNSSHISTTPLPSSHTHSSSGGHTPILNPTQLDIGGPNIPEQSSSPAIIGGGGGISPSQPLSVQSSGGERGGVRGVASGTTPSGRRQTIDGSDIDRGSQKDDPRRREVQRSLHFVERTPSPTDLTKFPPLPFINQPRPSFSGGGGFFPHLSSPNSYGMFHPDGGLDTPLQRLPSLSDGREEMTTFSSLPTSHFTLRPSTFDLDETPVPPHHRWSSGNSRPHSNPFDSGSWSWQRHLENEFSSGNFPLNQHSSPAPSNNTNYGSNLFHSNSVKHRASMEQVSSLSSSSAHAASGSDKDSHRDMSRSSLSVTNSKTIVLMNPPSLPADRKKESVSSVSSSSSLSSLAEKAPSQQQQQQQQQNHKLNSNTPSGNTSSQHKHPVAAAAAGKGEGSSVRDAVAGKPTGTEDGVPKSSSTLVASNKAGSVGDSVGSNSSSNAVGQTTKEGGGGGVQVKQESSSGNSSTHAASAGTATVVTKEGSANALPGGGSGGGSGSVRGRSEVGGVISNNSSGGGHDQSKKVAARDVVLDIWTMKGPASKVSLLDTSPPRPVSTNAASSSAAATVTAVSKRDSRTHHHLKKSRKKQQQQQQQQQQQLSSGGASGGVSLLESAHLVTSQFAVKAATASSKKKEDGAMASNPPETLSLPSLAPSLGGGGILVRGAGGSLSSSTTSSSRSGSNTPTVLSGVSGGSVPSIALPPPAASVPVSAAVSTTELTAGSSGGSGITQQKLLPPPGSSNSNSNTSSGNAVVGGSISTTSLGVVKLAEHLQANNNSITTTTTTGANNMAANTLPPLSSSSSLVAQQLHEHSVSVSLSSSSSLAVSDVKRTNSITEALVGHVVASQQQQQQPPPPSASVAAARLAAANTTTTSPGTNGTKFQELLNSTKRKLSETTERSLKQALAGTVVNHNSLLENTAKTLVPQTLKNSSEVT